MHITLMTRRIKPRYFSISLHRFFAFVNNIAICSCIIIIGNCVITSQAHSPTTSVIYGENKLNLWNGEDRMVNRLLL